MGPILKRGVGYMEFKLLTTVEPRLKTILGVGSSIQQLDSHISPLYHASGKKRSFT